MAEESEEKMGVIGAASIGVGGMVGGGIFAVLGTAVGLSGGGTPLAFALAGVVALLTAYSYAKLTVAYPSDGGTIVFLDRAFGVNLFTGSLNVLLWLSYLVTIALYASAFGSYGVTFFKNAPGWLEHTLMSAAILLPAAINILNSSIVSKSETVVVVIKLLMLGVVIAASSTQVDTARLALDTWASPGSLLMGGMVIFVAYEGFELIANAATDVKDPEKTIPRALYSSVLFVIVLYILVAIVTVGAVPADKIAEAKDYALAAAAKPSLGHIGFVLVSSSALLATFSAINATIYGNARLGYMLATEGELPEFIESPRWPKPVMGVVLTSGLSLLLANFIDVNEIALLGSAGFLAIFTMVNAAAFKKASEVHANRIVAGVATFASLVALIALLAHAYRDEPSGLLYFGGLVAFAISFEVIYPRITDRQSRNVPLQNHSET